MKVRSLLVTAVGLLVASTASAQQPNTCPHGTVNGLGIPDRDRATQDACQMAFDVFQFIAPQLGIAITGGNATLGQGGSLGGLGHFSVGLRANVLAADLPDVQSFARPNTNGRQAHQLPTQRQLVGLPAVDAG